MNKLSAKTLDDYKRWRVPELRDFLRNRGLKVTGTKEELVALAYAASEMNVPLVPNADDLKSARRQQYMALLNVAGKKLPDPLIDIADAFWIGEDDGIEQWPPIMLSTIETFLLSTEQRLTASLSKRMLSDYKEGKAFSYFDCNWLKEVKFHQIAPSHKHCFLKAKCTPSQNVNNPPHDVWVCAEKKTGCIASAYCSCFAGLGSTCNHVAALLFKVDYACTSGLTKFASPTSQECSWNRYGSKKDVMPTRLCDYEVRKPHYRKKKSGTSSKSKAVVVEPTVALKNRAPVPELSSLLFASSPGACCLQYIDLPASPNYEPDDDVNVESCVEVLCPPQTIQQIIATCPTDKVDDVLCQLENFSFEDVAVLESSTQEQSECTVWKEQRIGRITASLAHRVMTKVRSFHKDSEGTQMKTITRDICDPKTSSIVIPALNYGVQLEDEARKKYAAVVSERHKKFKVKCSGLYVLQKYPFVGASPDGIVTCECCTEGLLEIKCPYSSALRDPKDVVKYLTIVNGCQHLAVNHPYYSQVQHQMGVTNLTWCDFFIYSRHGYFLERIPFDKCRWQELLSAAIFFFPKFIIPYLLQKKTTTKEADANAMCSICDTTFVSSSSSSVCAAGSDKEFICDDCYHLQ